MATDVTTTTLDSVTKGQGDYSLAKIDVEGHELSVLQGGTRFLADNVRHIVFEDHLGPSSPLVSLLRDMGFELFFLTWELRRPLLLELKDFRPSSYESPNFIATRNENEIRDHFRTPGWEVLRG